ncbi:hypothetical protein LCGC14_2571970 [marine sediment metagenome]|uniref:Uncharacterized protein n=1 Tax=marine sediment metagenome TaxID=412755 RepID=A0A0F9CT50_9ZZZZ
MSQEVVAVAEQIKKIIEAIKTEGARSNVLILAKAEAMRLYDKAVAIKELKLKNDGMAIGLINHQAKGDASQLMCEMIVAQESLKAHWQRITYLLAQLNGWQSIYRNLTHT